MEWSLAFEKRRLSSGGRGGAGAGEGSLAETRALSKLLTLTLGLLVCSVHTAERAERAGWKQTYQPSDGDPLSLSLSLLSLIHI